MKSGVIKNYNTGKGYGFIRENVSNDELFFHVSDCIELNPVAGMKVQFETGHDRRGRAKAINISAAKNETNGKSERAEVENWNKQ
jgi:cold shock CspA family protein